MSTHNFLVVREELKGVLKARKVRYGRLASEMGISESGVKKMLNGKDLSYNKICKVLGAAGIGVSDFFKSIEEAAPPEKVLTPKQQEYFLKNPNSYYFLYQLLGLDLDWKKLKKRHGLSQKSVDSYLLALDKIGAIELHAGNKIKSDYAGNCRISFGMPLMKQVVDQKHRSLLNFAHIPNEKFRGRKYLVNGILSLKPSTATEFNKDLKELLSDYMKRSQRESLVEAESSREDIGFLFVITPTEGMNHEAIPDLP